MENSRMPQPTRARTPPLKTKERNDGRIAAASHSFGGGRSAGTTTERQQLTSTKQFHSGDPSRPVQREPSPVCQRRASSSPPLSPVEISPTAQLSGRSSSPTPSTVPRVGSPASGQRSNPSPDFLREVSEPLHQPLQFSGHVNAIHGARSATEQATLAHSPADGKHSDTEVSFDLSPIQRRTATNYCDVGGLFASKLGPPPTTKSQLSQQPQFARDRAASEDTDLRASGRRMGIRAPCADGATTGPSKFAATRNMWEARASGTNTPVVSENTMATERRRPVSKSRRSSSWLQCQSDNLAPRLKRAEQQANWLTEKLLAKLQVHEANGFPEDSSGDTSGLLSIEEDFDVADSPKTQACKGLIQNSHAMWRSQRKLTKAVIRVLSLDSSRDCVRCADTKWTGGDSEAVKEMLPSSVLSEKNADNLKVNDHAFSHDRRRGSLPSSQPESEAVPEGSPEGCQVEQSTCLTDEAEPAREPQPQESPRECMFVPVPGNDIENDGIPSIVHSASDLASCHSDSPSVDVERSTSSMDDSYVACAPRAGEDGIPRSQALLPQLLQLEMNRELRIVVPEGMDPETRQVSFTFENKQHTVKIPENFEVGMEVPITISKRPALEQNSKILHYRGLPNAHDRSSIVDSLRHGARPVGAESDDCLNSQEFKYRQFLYSLLRGNAMHPLLPWTPEEDDMANNSTNSAGR